MAMVGLDPYRTPNSNTIPPTTPTLTGCGGATAFDAHYVRLHRHQLGDSTWLGVG